MFVWDMARVNPIRSKVLQEDAWNFPEDCLYWNYLIFIIYEIYKISLSFLMQFILIFSKKMKFWEFPTSVYEFWAMEPNKEELLGKEQSSLFPDNSFSWYYLKIDSLESELPVVVYFGIFFSWMWDKVWMERTVSFRDSFWW